MNSRHILPGLAAISAAGLFAPAAIGQSLVLTNGQVFAANGMQVPGMPTGVVFGGSSTFDSPSVDEAGNLLFRCRMQDPGGVAVPPIAVTNDRALLFGATPGTLAMVARNGDAAPGIVGVTINTGTTTPTGNGLPGSPRLSPNGQLFYGASIAGAGLTTADDSAIFAGPSGTQQVLVREGAAAPSGGATLSQSWNGLSHQGVGMNRNGRYVFRSSLAGGDVSGSTNNDAVFTGTLGGSMDWVLRKGDALGGGTQVVSALGGFLQQLNDSGQILHDATLSQTLGSSPATPADDKILFVYTPGSGNTAVAREGAAAPGTVGATFNVASNSWSINVPPNAFTAAGQFLLHADLLNGDVVAGVNDRAIYLGSTSGLTMALRRGDAAPGTDANINVWNFSNCGLVSGNRFFFQSTLVGGTTTTANDSGIWSGTPGNLQLVVREGQILPGTVATEMVGSSGSFGPQFAMMGESGQVLFQTNLINGDVVAGTNDRALCIWDPIQGLRVVARMGEQIEVSPGNFKTISGFGSLQFNNCGGTPLGLSPSGKLGLQLFMLDGTSAVVRVSIDVQPGAPYCFGDGSGTACPCGNAGVAGRGCGNSVDPNGGRVVATGQASLGADTVTLVGTNMPNSSALYIQGTVQQNGGAGVAFGDGLRCAGGSVIRLKTVFNVAGASQFPEAGDPTLSVRGLVTTPGTRVYQAWYRNAAVFCTSDTFNLTNGWQLSWTL